MSLHHLPNELLLEVLMHLQHKDDRPWLASVALVCRAFKPLIESILYREAVIATYQGLHRFCASVIGEPSRGIAVRKLVLNLDLNPSVPSGPLADLELYLAPALRLLVNLGWLELFADDPTILSLLIDVPFHLRTLHVLCSFYPSYFEDVIASHPTLEQLELGFEEGCAAPLQVSHPEILRNLRTLSTLSEDFLALYGLYTYSNLTCLSLRHLTHGDTSNIFSLLPETLISVKVARYMEDECTQSCIWPTSVLRTSRLPRLKRLEVHDLGDRVIDILVPSLAAITASHLQEACPLIAQLIWNPGCVYACECKLHIPPTDSQGDQSMLFRFVEIMFEHAPSSMESLFVARTPPYEYSNCWLEGDIFKRALQPDHGRVQQLESEALYDEDEWGRFR